MKLKWREGRWGGHGAVIGFRKIKIIEAYVGWDSTLSKTYQGPQYKAAINGESLGHFETLEDAKTAAENWVVDLVKEIVKENW